MNAVILGAAGDPVRSPREAHIECLARVRERMPGGQVRVLVVPAKRNYRFVVSLSTHERIGGKRICSFHHPLTLALSRKGRGD